MSWSQFLFSFRGRVSVGDYWGRCVLPQILLLFLFVVVLSPHATSFTASAPDDRSTGSVAVSAAFDILGVALTWLLFVGSVKRFHDRGRSGWFLLAYLIPVVGQIWVMVELFFLSGTRGPNKYGPEPE